MSFTMRSDKLAIDRHRTATRVLLAEVQTYW